MRGRLFWWPFLDPRTLCLYLLIVIRSPCPSLGQFLFGNPSIFITSNDTDETFNEFQLIHDGTRFYKLSEYIQFGIDVVTKFMIVYIDLNSLLDFTIALTVEDMRIATIEQNLQKELFFSHYNSSGVFPQMLIINSTTTERLDFKASLYPIGYSNHYDRDFETMEMAPPYDVVIEVPGYSQNLVTQRTLIDVQSFPLLRFQLSADSVVNYEAIRNHSEAVVPTVWKNDLSWHSLESSIKIIPTPCIQDYFLIFLRVGLNSSEKGSHPAFSYIQVPAHYTPGNDGCWINLTSIYCSDIGYEEECGEPEDIILTNRHLLVMSSKGLLVSNDLTESTVRESERISTYPLARFDYVDPCKGIGDCFSTLSHPMEKNLIFARKLQYTPFCDVIQYPNNEDMVIFILEHTEMNRYRDQPTGRPGSGLVKTFSVTFAARPYKEWRPLFKSQGKFENRDIMEIIGIFYNVQTQLFDITLRLSAHDGDYANTRAGIQGKNVRFVLPLPTQEPYITEGYPELSGHWGKSIGFMVQNFSESFIINGVAVNPGTMDVIFYGSEIHIAESGRPIVYQALGGFINESDSVTSCHFNHPDRFYVCMLSHKTSILIGRVATWYGPVEVSLQSLVQIQELIDVIFAVSKRVEMDEPPHEFTQAQQDVLDYIFERAFFTASYSGKIYMWYFSDPTFFYEKIKEHDEQCKTGLPSGKPCPHTPLPSRPELTHNAGGLTECGILNCAEIPCILPLPLDPLMFKVKNSATSGALVPFLIDSERILLYEAFVGGEMSEDILYLGPVFIGQKIYCNEEGHENDDDRQDHYQCALYFRHIKYLRQKGSNGEDDTILPGFRSCIFATVVKPVPMYPVSDYLLIQMAPDSNKVRILCYDKDYQAILPCNDLKQEDVGKTLYVPGEYSVLLQGYDWQIEGALIGIATHKTVLPFEVKAGSRESFIMSMRTERHSMAQVHPILFQKPHIDPNVTYGCNTNPPAPCKFTNHHPLIPPNTLRGINDWEIGDGGCQFEMNLIPNSYIKTSGSKIDLDLQDSVSFEVELRPLTPLGMGMLYRPLMLVTQSNPEILHVSSRFNRLPDRQIISVLLKPTGVKQGVSSFVIRCIVSSISCSSPSSVTLIVQCVRAEGRKLKVVYPYDHLLDMKTLNADILNPDKVIQVTESNPLYIKLPANYRPPSIRGVKIPLTKNVYNADPSKPLFNSWYKVSEESAELKVCKAKRARNHCGCTDYEKLSDDPKFSDCKEKVCLVGREEEIKISVDYPPRLPHNEQQEDFFSPPPNITVTIQEVNGRLDYTVDNPRDLDASTLEMLEGINNDPALNMGETYYVGSDLRFRLRGTGLYHFKVTLGRFHTFNEVTAYVILYSDTSEVDDVLLVMIVIVTMTLCFILVFLFFLRSRHKFVAHLPLRGVEPGGA